MSLFTFGPTPVQKAVPFGENLWVGVVIFGVISILALGYGGWWSWQNHLFADHSRLVDGKVFQKYLVKSQGKHGPIYTPHLFYDYQVGNLQVSVDTAVESDTYNQIAEGWIIPIKYLPEDPSNSRIANTAEDFKPEWKGRGGLIAGALGVVFCIANAIQAKRRKKVLNKLATAGLSTVGTVTSVEMKAVGKGQMRAYLRFEFTDNLGRTAQGQTGLLTRKQESLWSMGNKITVYYDPADTQVFTVNPNVSIKG